MTIALLILGFVILIYGADLLVKGAASIAGRFKVPPIVIGLTIVAFGTSSPELVVNIFAVINKNDSLVLGNVIGSNIFNTAFILGVCALIYPLSVQNTTTWIEIPLSLLAAVVVFVTVNDILLDQKDKLMVFRSEGILLLAFFLVFLSYSTGAALKGTTEKIEVKIFSFVKSLLFVLFGLALLIAGGKLIVNNAVIIAKAIGLSERVIGLTVVSIGTSLPELATSVVAVRKKHVDLAVGNVVGSNIFNIFFILGVSATIHPLQILPEANFDVLSNIVVSFLLFFFVFSGKGRKIHAWEGLVFLILYLGYIIFLLLR